MQNAHAKLAVLVLLAPDAGGRVHQRRKRAVGAAESPDAGELSRDRPSALADQSNGGGDVARFLDRGLDARAERIGFRIVMAPQAAVLDVDGFGKIGGEGQEAVLGDVVQPLDDFRNAAARARPFRQACGTA